MNSVLGRLQAQPLVFPGVLGTLELVRAVAFIGGSSLLFWQHDLAPVDWLFGIGIATSGLLWLRGRPAFDLAWPQPLLAVFLGVTAAATVAAGGSLRFLVITIYLVLAALAFASILRGNERAQRATELAIILAAALTAGTIVLAVIARQAGWESLSFLHSDYLRTRGLFKDPNVAGGFLAIVYPLAASWCLRRPRHRLAWLLVVTAAVAFGVVFSFSRLALAMFAIGFLGVAAALVVLRERRLLTGFVAGTTAAAVLALSVVGIGNLPLYRYQPIQAYDEAGRFQAWGFGVQMLAEAPLGTGAGSFEGRSSEKFRATAEARAPAAPPPVTVPAAPLAGFHSRWAGQSADPRLRSGEASAPLTVTLQNTGSRAWTKGTSDQAALEVTTDGLIVGDPARPVAQLSGLVDLSRTAMPIRWPSPTRVAVQQEETVAPGALGRFLFQVRAPQTPGTYVLALRPVVDSAGPLEDEGIRFRLSVSGAPVERAASAAAPRAPDAPPVAAAPAAYRVPPGALRVADSAGLLAALASATPRDIVLADGVYDEPGPFTNAAGHRVYAETPGRAVLRAGFVLGANDGQGNGLLQGIAFDVNDPAKTLQNSAVHVWGSGAGSRILDVTFTGNRVVGSAIAARQVEGVVVQRVRIRDFTEFGILVDANTSGLTPANSPLLEDLDIGGIGRAEPSAAFGPTEVCLRVGNTVIVRRAQLRSCAWAGIWTGGASLGSLFERVDVDIARFGAFVDGGTAGNVFRDLRLGPAVLSGLLPTTRVMTPEAPPGSPATVPGGPAPPALTETPSAHNMYLRVAVESGVIGFVALVAYFALLLIGAIRTSSRLSWHWPLAFAIVLIAGLGIDTLHWRGLWVYVAIVGALMGPLVGPVPFAGSLHRIVRRGRRSEPAAAPSAGLPDGSPPAIAEPPDRPPARHEPDQAIARARTVLDNRTAAFGPRHPDVAMAMHQLATIHHERGDAESAAALYVDAIRIYEESLSPDSPVLVWLLEDLATLRRDQGLDREADALFSRALAIVARMHRQTDLPRDGRPGGSSLADRA